MFERASEGSALLKLTGMTDRTSLLGSSGPNSRTQCDPVEDMADVERELIVRVDIEHHLEEDSLADGRQEQPINEAQNRQSNFTGRSGGDLLRIRPRWGHAMAARTQSRYRPGSRNRRATRVRSEGDRRGRPH